MPIYFEGSDDRVGVAWDTNKHRIEIGGVILTPETAIKLAVEAIALAKQCIEYREETER